MGGGYGQFENSEGGTLTVTARVSTGASRYAMPSIPELVYAALLYEDGEIPKNPKSKDFVQGTAAEDGKLIFSFQRPDDTSGTFTLEIFAFVKTDVVAEDGTANFSRNSALFSGYKERLAIVGDAIVVTDPIALSSNESGTVNLKIKVPDGCTLELKELKIDGTTEGDSHFAITGASPNFTIKQNDENGILAGAYQVTFTVKKDEEIIYIFSEYINVINGLCTDTWWNGDVSSEVKDVSQSMSKTVYVRGTGGWYDKPEHYKDTAMADDNNTGSFLSPLSTIQKAIDKIIAINDGSSAYTIYVDGTLTQAKAEFSTLSPNLNLTIKALSGTATLDANQKSGSVIYISSNSGVRDLTLENLILTGGNTGSSGGGVFVTGGAKLTMKNCTITGNKASYGGGVYVANGSTFIMEDGEISNNNVGYYGGGVYVPSGGTFIMEGGTVSGNTASKNGGGVYVKDKGKFTMSGGTISGNTANQDGGGVYVTGSESTLTMNDGTINKNTAQNGGGVYVDGSSASGNTFTMSNGTISGGNATKGGGVYVNSGKFEMAGGTISDCTATQGGGIYNSSNGTLTIESGTKISGCESGSWGGGIDNERGTAVINGCTIELCEAKGDSDNMGGGGIYSCGTLLTVTGGTIYKCSAKQSKGGGLFLNGSQCTVAGVTISECTAKDGGGVGLYYNATFTMKDDTIISKNTASGSGGGVYLAGSSASGNTFTMEGGTVSGNTAQNTQGNGAFVCPDCALNMSGKAQFAKDDDVYLYAYDNSTIPTITVAGSLTAASPVATITPSAYTAGRQVLSADGVMLYNSGCNKFAVTPDSDGADWSIAPDASYKAGMLIRPSFYVRGSGAGWYAENPAFTASAGSDTTGKGSKTKPFATIQKAIDEVTAQSEVIAQKDGSSGEYTIYVDGTLTLNDTPTNGMADFYAFNQRITLTITALSETTKATLDANQKSRVIYAKPKGGSLILTMKNLVITKGRIYTPSSEARGGGIYWDGSQLTIDGCIISENSAARSYSYKSAGGGIYSDGRLIMDDCIISKNTAANGGGIYNFSQFIMHSGSISGNEATDGDGGGFYNDGSGANYFVMDAGTISGNTASGNGGGVYDQRGKFTQNGGTVSGNTPNDVYDQP